MINSTKYREYKRQDLPFLQIRQELFIHNKVKKMNVTNKHWGDIDSHPKEQHYVPDVSADIEKSMNKFCLAEFDADANDSQKLDQLFLDPMNPLMLYAITLHKYAKDMAEKIRVAEQAHDTNLLPPLEDVPIPELVQPPKKHLRNSLNYINKDFTPFSLGQEVEIPEISEAVSKQILIKCVAVMFAHVGFETTHQSVLDFMTDVLESILKKMALKLKVAHEDEVNEQSFGFPNTVERIFVEMGIGGLKGLHDYYETRVVQYVNVLHKRCQNLYDQYERLLEPKSSSPDDKINKIIRIKVEKEDIVEENPELHFENGDLGATSLETGFQLLNSLEAGANLVEEEDMNVVAGSSGVVSINELDLPSASPLNKKKRTK